MSNNELLAFMKKCSIDETNLPIRIESTSVLFNALSLFINRAKSELKIFLRFLDEEEHELFSALNSDDIGRNLTDFLNQKNVKITIISNNTKRVKSSDFYKRISSIKPKVYSLRPEITERLTARSYVVADDVLVLVGNFNYSPSKEIKKSFVNFNDGLSATALTHHFNEVVDLILNGGTTK